MLAADLVLHCWAPKKRSIFRTIISADVDKPPAGRRSKQQNGMFGRRKPTYQRIKKRRVPEQNTAPHRCYPYQGYAVSSTS